MATVGPNASGTQASEALAGSSVPWVSPASAVSSNDVRSSAVLSLGAKSEYLKATNFGFAIPAGATIDGITVAVERSQAGPDTAKDNSVRLFKAGSVAGSDKATATAWPGTDASVNYGGAADLWGTTWTATDINDSGFGVGVSAQPGGGLESVAARIDFVSITVDYTLASITRSQRCSVQIGCAV